MKRDWLTATAWLLVLAAAICLFLWGSPPSGGSSRSTPGDANGSSVTGGAGGTADAADAAADQCRTFAKDASAPDKVAYWHVLSGCLYALEAIYLHTEFYGQEMSAGDPLLQRQVIRSDPHEPDKKWTSPLFPDTTILLCRHCGSLYITK